MPTCPSCSAEIAVEDTACSQCGVVLRAMAVGADSGGAPTLPMFGLDGEPSTRSIEGRVQSMIGREIIGQYVITAKLGEGGMGEVYLADQPAIGRQVAIKIVHSDARERDLDELATRFRNEAKAVASLESPHIVQIFNYGALEDGTSFMAMEYLDGQTLADLVREQHTLEPERAVAIATQICAALSEAHAAGIVHRDLKPSNVMLIQRADTSMSSREGPGEFVKVLDFGVAKLEGSDITRSGAMFGTPQYMSPEQLRGSSNVDGRSDLYSLGVMLYELLAGQLPFSSPTAVGYITAHLYHEPPPLPRSVPPALAEIVSVLMAKEASERPPDAASVAEELQAALAGRSITARRRRRKRALRSVAGMTVMAVGVVLLAGLGYASWRWRVDLDSEHQAELERERERAAALEQRLAEQQAAIQTIRADAEIADVQLQNSKIVRAQREAQVAQRQAPSKLDDKIRAQLTRSRAQLEAELRQVVEQRRIPPSEVAELWASQAELVAAVESGARDEAELREHLAAMIELYRKNFEREAEGDSRSLAELEPLFLSMATRDALDFAERQARIDAIHETYDGKPLPEIDRAYFKALALAKLIREQHVEGAADGGAGLDELLDGQLDGLLDELEQLPEQFPEQFPEHGPPGLPKPKPIPKPGEPLDTLPPPEQDRDEPTLPLPSL